MANKADQLIKGDKVTLTVVVNGKPLTGSFKTVESVGYKPISETEQVEFLGDPTSAFYKRHDGYEVTWTQRVSDNAVFAELDDLYVAAQAAGVLPPRVDLVFTVAFKDPAKKSVSHTFVDAKVNTDNAFEVGGRTNFATSTFTARCSTRTTV